MDHCDITVGVRVRPLNKREVDLCSSICVDVQGSNAFIRLQTGGASKTQFAFDHSWACNHEDPSNASQASVFGDVGLKVVKFLTEGHNVCVFAYGQSGSGKTHTMMGSVTDPGLVPRICQALLQLKEQETSTDVEHRFQLSYLEIHNEKIHDLLIDGVPPSKGTPCKFQMNRLNKSMKKLDAKLGNMPRDLPNRILSESVSVKGIQTGRVSPNKLHIRRSYEKGIHVSNLTEVWVASYKEVEEHLRFGNKRKSTAEIRENTHSSRGHSVLTITYTRTIVSRDIPHKTISKLHLIDLAGRDDLNGATGSRLSEGRHINRSLAALSNVLSKLSKAGKAAAHVPFRDSLLTHLLQDSLGRNSKIFMIATISPASCNCIETLATLQSVSGAKRARTSPTDGSPRYITGAEGIKTLPTIDTRCYPSSAERIGTLPTVNTRRYTTSADRIKTLPTVDTRCYPSSAERIGTLPAVNTCYTTSADRIRTLPTVVTSRYTSGAERIKTSPIITPDQKVKIIRKSHLAIELSDAQLQQRENHLLKTIRFIMADLKDINKKQDAFAMETLQEELARRLNEHLGSYSQTDFQYSLDCSGDLPSSTPTGPRPALRLAQPEATDSGLASLESSYDDDSAENGAQDGLGTRSPVVNLNTALRSSTGKIEGKRNGSLLKAMPAYLWNRLIASPSYKRIADRIALEDDTNTSICMETILGESPSTVMDLKRSLSVRETTMRQVNQTVCTCNVKDQAKHILINAKNISTLTAVDEVHNNLPKANNISTQTANEESQNYIPYTIDVSTHTEIYECSQKNFIENATQTVSNECPILNKSLGDVSICSQNFHADAHPCSCAELESEFDSIYYSVQSSSYTDLMSSSVIGEQTRWDEDIVNDCKQQPHNSTFVSCLSDQLQFSVSSVDVSLQNRTFSVTIDPSPTSTSVTLSSQVVLPSQIMQK